MVIMIGTWSEEVVELLLPRWRSLEVDIDGTSGFKNNLMGAKGGGRGAANNFEFRTVGRVGSRHC